MAQLPAHPLARDILSVTSGVQWVQINYVDMHGRENVVGMTFRAAMSLLEHLELLRSADETPPRPAKV